MEPTRLNDFQSAEFYQELAAITYVHLKSYSKAYLLLGAEKTHADSVLSSVAGLACGNEPLLNAMRLKLAITFEDLSEIYAFARPETSEQHFVDRCFDALLKRIDFAVTVRPKPLNREMSYFRNAVFCLEDLSVAVDSYLIDFQTLPPRTPGIDHLLPDKLVELINFVRRCPDADWESDVARIFSYGMSFLLSASKRAKMFRRKSSRSDGITPEHVFSLLHREAKATKTILLRS